MPYLQFFAKKMSEELKAIVEEMAKCRHSFIGKEISHEDVLKVLEAVGNFVRDYLLQNNVVVIPGIGTFALSRQKLLISHLPIKYVINQKPVFQLAHALALKFRLKWARIQYETTLPERWLNPTTIALANQLARSKVVLSMQEIVAYIEQMLATKRNVTIPFLRVGTLKIVGENWRMDFNHEFLNKVSLNDVIHVAYD
ncbi:uncharacterized protein LOC118199430 [Stegodyphus dumicola]|uniref:uncharacterized protein LOC118199430 n=1 Tax=Stegodyphus dumicola TaxID=202533 RepID=UPI0015A93BD7|nr:uncharacterized protein LOC118199430 [Stegodyphus dumicola]